jgi:hypothetical protein
MGALYAAYAHGVIVMFAIGMTLILGALALIVRARVVAYAAVLSMVIALGLIAWPSLKRVIDPERFTPPRDVSITRHGTGDLRLEAPADYLAGPGIAECRHEQSAYLFRTVSMTDAGRLRGTPLRVALLLLREDVSVIVVAHRVSGDPAMSWSGVARLERGDEFAGRVTFERLSSLGEPGAWPAELSGQIEWSCRLEPELPVPSATVSR